MVHIYLHDKHIHHITSCVGNKSQSSKVTKRYYFDSRATNTKQGF